MLHGSVNHGFDPAAQGLSKFARGVFSHRCRLLAGGSRNGEGARMRSRQPPNNKLGVAATSAVHCRNMPSMLRE